MSQTPRVIKAAVFLALFAALSPARVKNVAVIETEVDPQSSAVAELTPAEVRLVTAER
jgi:hypothetical protein